VSGGVTGVGASRVGGSAAGPSFGLCFQRPGLWSGADGDLQAGPC